MTQTEFNTFVNKLGMDLLQIRADAVLPTWSLHRCAGDSHSGSEKFLSKDLKE